jgi:hypothetical protein
MNWLNPALVVGAVEAWNERNESTSLHHLTYVHTAAQVV